jgi:hypothetical protein
VGHKIEIFLCVIENAVFLISDFRRVLKLVCFLLGISLASVKFCRHFGTLCQVHLQRLDEEYE